MGSGGSEVLQDTRANLDGFIFYDFDPILDEVVVQSEILTDGDVTYDSITGAINIAGGSPVTVYVPELVGIDYDVTLSAFTDTRILLTSPVSFVGVVPTSTISGDGGDVAPQDDTLSGTGAADIIYGYQQDDSIVGGDGDDYLFGDDGMSPEIEDGDDTLLGQGGNDTLYGTDGYDVLDGGVGNDLLYGGDWDDTLIGGAGNDTLIEVDYGDDDLFGGAGDDLINTDASGSHYIDGGDGNDRIFVNSGGDTILGGAGNDLISLDNADQTIVTGEEGDDTIFATGMSAGENLLVAGELGNDYIFTHDGDDTIYGGAGVDTINGWGGDDLIVGDEGADILTGGMGADTFTGHANDLHGDTITDFDLIEDKLVIDWGGGAPGTISVTDSGLDAIVNFCSYSLTLENLGISLSELTSNLGAVFQISTLAGGLGTGGPDNLVGTSSQDTIDGLAGADTIIGLGDDDLIYGRDGNDQLDGNEGNDLLIGGVGLDTLSGGLGDDSLVGGDTNDLMLGGAGHDSLDGGNDGDTLYGGTGDDTLDGGGSDDRLYGNQGTDSLLGGAGDDTLVSTSGDDVLIGGAGSDVFVIDASNASGSYGNVVIDDFDSTQDTLVFVPTLDVANTSSIIVDVDAFNAYTNLYIDIDGDGTDDVTIQLNNIAPVGDVVTATATGVAEYTGIGSDIIFNSAPLTSSGSGADEYVTDYTPSSIDAGAGDDYVVAPGGIQIEGGDGSDTIIGDNTASENLYNASIVTFDDNSADVIYGNGGGDTLYGGDNDTLYGGADVDYFVVELPSTIGTTTVDIADFSSIDGILITDPSSRTPTIAATPDLVAGVTNVSIDASGSELVLRLPGIFGNFPPSISLSPAGVMLPVSTPILALPTIGNDDVLGTYDNDTIDLTANVGGVDTIRGFSGDDDITASWNNTSIEGGFGNDTINASQGQDTVYGGSGHDSILGDQGSVLNPDGNDVLYGGDGDDYIMGDDNLTGDAAGADLIYGDAGNDTLLGEFNVADAAAIDTIYGGTGADVIYGFQGSDLLYGNQDADVIYGGDGADSVFAGQGNDVVYGGNGDDTLVAGAGQDTIYGGAADSDVFVAENYRHLDDDVIYQFEGPTDQIVINNVSGITADNFRLVTISGVGARIEIDEDFDGTADIQFDVNNNGAMGFNSFNITGTTTLTITLDDAAVNVGSGSPGFDSVEGDGVQGSFFLSAGDDTFVGHISNFNETVDGEAGRDLISGDDGSDVLSGGDGSDTILGELGNDSLYGDAGNDKLEGGTGNDTLDPGVGNADVRGGDGDDELIVGKAVNSNHIFDGEAGDDTIVMNDNDVSSSGDIRGGTGTDTLKLMEFGVEFNFSNGSGITQNVDSDAFTGFERIVVYSGVDSVALNADDVIDMSSASSLDVILEGSSSQVLNLDNNLVDTGKDEFRDGYTFSIYEGGGATVYVANDDGATINSVSGLV